MDGGTMNLNERAKALKIMIPALFLAMKKRETPSAAKIMAALTVGYALSPIDLIPDFIPVLGYLDDLIILPFLAAMTIRLIPKEIMDACKLEAEGLWASGKPKKWIYAIPIIAIWTAIIAIIIYKIML
jgi:uncharacterized membrane protein YkvA (DUF1232 family)